MIDLNNSEFAGKEVTIFNGGTAGLVPNVTVRVEKRKIEEPETNPLFKVFFIDERGGVVNQAWWNFTPNENNTEEKNKDLQGYYISRLLHLARAVMGKTYTFPPVESVAKALELVMDLVANNSSDKKFNVFVTYGTTRKPSKYLNVRYFNFIELAQEGCKSLMTPSNVDLMERLQADQPSTPTPSDPGTDWTTL